MSASATAEPTASASALDPGTAKAGPRFPSTLAPPAYYNGLEDRLRKTLLPVLEPYFTASAEPSDRPLRVLELASGTGSHSILFASSYADQIESIRPTECDDYGRERIDETVAAAGRSEGRRGVTEKIKRARRLDVMDGQDWQALAGSTERSGAYNLVFGSNFLHMIPFPEGPRRIFSHLLAHKLVNASSARLIFYGPFRPSMSDFFSPSDEKFDAEISSRPQPKSETPYRLGLRPLDELFALAKEEGWQLEAKHTVEANGNWVLVFRPSL
ncbi:hypothetical protein JCM10908_006480 [Rhodotorula pacifica]|uniref:uncharacterized protein n=1 Tax=Rhodotorula pacifica TaxID=1495444 RepID=UPI0031788453